MLWGGAAVVAVAAAGWWWSERAAETPSTLAAEPVAATTTAAASAAKASPARDPAAELPVVRMSPPPPGSDKPIIREISPKPAPVRDLSFPASADPQPIPVTRRPPTEGSATVAATPGTADPRAACGKKVFLTLTLCIDRLCRDPAYRQHGECVRLREIRDQRDQQRN
jgi:non-specific serine/threonine protein kinase